MIYSVCHTAFCRSYYRRQGNIRCPGLDGLANILNVNLMLDGVL